MNTKKKTNGFQGFGMYALLILAFILVWYITTMPNKTTTITEAGFAAALESGNVEAVKITQNKEVPTGTVTIQMKDKSQAKLYVSDVNEIQELMKSYIMV